ncbi:MAG: GNAT family N-acetyltransferase [Promethearchaeota archaeon]
MSKPKPEITVFDPHTASDDLWKKLFDFYEKILLEIFPDDPLPSRERIKKNLQNPDPNFKNYRWMIHSKEKDKVIGYGKVSIYDRSAPAYKMNKHIAFCDLSIDKKHRRLRLGSELLKIQVNKVKEEGKMIIQGGSHLKTGKAFCEQYGGKIALTEEESRLSLDEVDWKIVNEWITKGSQRTEGVTIAQFEIVPEEDIEEYCKLFTETLNQVPKGELEWEEVETPVTRRIREKHSKILNQTWTTIISKEKDGVISGLTETFYQPDQATLLYQGLTGVKKEYRGRGLGKWLKAEMLTYARKMFPEVRFVATDFAIINKPMIAINKQLGFRKYKIWNGYKFNVEELHKLLHSND